jgi:hypothetical protein
VGVAALATVGLAAPAVADNHDTSDIYVVHGIPGRTVDVYVDGERLLQNFEPRDVAGPVELPAGDYQIQVVAAGETDLSAAAIDEVETVPAAGLSISIVAHLDADGTPVLTPFVNDTSEIAEGEGRLSVRHTAAAPAVDVFLDDALTGFQGVENGGDGDVDVPVGTYSAFVAAAGSDEPAIGPADVEIRNGVNTIVYAVGDLSADPSTATFYIQTIGEPAGSPAGGAGLVAEGANSGLIGGAAALLIALLAGAGIIARRTVVASK